MPGAQIESTSWLSESNVFSVRHATPALHPAYGRPARIAVCNELQNGVPTTICASRAGLPPEKKIAEASSSFATTSSRCASSRVLSGRTSAAIPSVP